MPSSQKDSTLRRETVALVHQGPVSSTQQTVFKVDAIFAGIYKDLAFKYNNTQAIITRRHVSMSVDLFF